MMMIDDDDRGDVTFDQKSFSSQHVPHSLLFSWWQPFPGSGHRSYSGEMVWSPLRLPCCWCSSHFGTFFKTCSAVGRSWRRSCRNMAPGMMWTRFYSLWKKCSGKRSIRHDFHFSCLPFLRLLMKIEIRQFIWNLEVYASVEQILHHGRVFVCSRHVQNILSIVPGW